MLILVTGGSASGKSTYAEQLVTELPGRRIYMATMQAWDEECRRRIAKHRKQRAGKGFATLERCRNLAGLTQDDLRKCLEAPDCDAAESGVPLAEPDCIADETCVLLEDLGNLAANELYGPDGENPEAYRRICEGLLHLQELCSHLVVVSCRVGSDGISYDASTQNYIRLIGMLEEVLANKADRVYEVVCGIPLRCK